jgi:signal transduction histidine kinase/ligand-binding sensor domain-containing protein
MPLFINPFILNIIKQLFSISLLKLSGNHYLRRYLWISLFYLACCVPLQSQSRYSQFNHLTTDNGLSSNRIWCICRDSKDYLWMGTDVGLDKYDSYEVKKYRHDENLPGTISSDNILFISEDRNKNLWIGTNDGLNLYDPEKDNFKIFKNSRDDKTSLNSNYVCSIVQDNSGIMWILTDGTCLNKWVPETQSFVRYQFKNIRNTLWARPAKMMTFDSKGKLWIVSLNNGLNCFDPESGKFKEFVDPSIDFGSNCFKSIYIDKRDKIWITTDGNGFFSYDPVKDKFEQFGSKGDGKGTNQEIILAIIPEDDTHLLLGVDQGGINRFDMISKTFEYFIYDNLNEDGLNNNGIWCLYRDSEGILWVGTSGGGINYINPRQSKFKLYRHTNNPNSLSYNFTGCLFEDHEGMIWIGTDDGGVNIYDPVKGIFKQFKHIEYDPNSISGDVIRSITEDRDQNIWIATWDAGLNRYDRKTNKFYRFKPDESNPAGISGNTTWYITLDHNGNLWLGNYAVGTDLFDVKKGVLKRFRSDLNDPKSISSNQPYFFYEDVEKNMWICTENGLNLYDYKTNSFKVYNFPNNQIEAFLRDKDGNLWIGSNTKGLFFCKPDGTIIKTYDITNGLSNNKVQAIVEDDHGNMWISTSGGISRLDIKTQKFRNYTKEDGLQSNQFFQQSFLKTRKGEIYFGGYNGFNSFYPDSLKDNNFIPPVYITDFQIFNKPVNFAIPGGQFPTHISEAKEITLNWKQSVFSFSFSAINYTSPEKNQYSYIMEGFENEWNFTNASRRYVTYTNLDPGEYTFRVIASNNDELWNTKGVSLRIVILPPWWKTIWFKIISVSLILFVLVSFFLIRVRSLKSQKILLEKSVEIKTSELQEKNDTLIKQAEKLNQSNILLEERQMEIESQKEELVSQQEILVNMNKELDSLNVSKDKFFSIIAHDLKNPFSTIIGFSEIQMDDIKSGNLDGIEESATMINISAVQTFRLLENLLEWAKAQRGKLTFNPEPLDLKILMREEIKILSDMAKTKNISLESSIPENIKIVADQNMIKTIIRNLISNAIKFTHRNGKVEVMVRAENQYYNISVSDTGIGMTDDIIAKIFRIDSDLSTPGTDNERGTGLGLFLCKEFVEKHNGKIWVESISGKGSTFTFSLPSSLMSI